ncbi:MAG: hypothetical protein SGPRY_011585 [Prymnesium sp.]
MQADFFKPFKQAFDSALQDVQQAASEAAGQEENPWEAERRGVEELDARSVSPLPDSFDDAVDQAIIATAEAMADGSTQLVVEFDTSAGDETYNLLSRTMKLVEPYLPLFESKVLPPPVAASEPTDESEKEKPSPRFQLLFPDEGTSAYVAQKEEPARGKRSQLVSAGTRCGSMPRVKFEAGVEAVFIVAPGATEVAEEAFDTPVILFNPKLVDMQSTGYGLVGRELRTMVDSTFDNCFCLKSFVEGALFRVYPEDQAAEGGYVLAYKARLQMHAHITKTHQETKRPSGDEIDEILNPDEEDDGGQMMSGFASFVKGFQAL